MPLDSSLFSDSTVKSPRARRRDPKDLMAEDELGHHRRELN
jgi:hypothetical protein